MTNEKKFDFNELIEKWPSAIVSRQEVGKFSGGALNPGTLANLDCQNKGPEGRMRIGKKVCYPAKSLARWIQKNTVYLN